MQEEIGSVVHMDMQRNSDVCVCVCWLGGFVCVL